MIMGVFFRKFLSMPMSSKFLYMFFSSDFDVSGVIIRSLGNFKLILMESERCRSSFFTLLDMWISSDVNNLDFRSIRLCFMLLR